MNENVGQNERNKAERGRVGGDSKNQTRLASDRDNPKPKNLDYCLWTENDWTTHY